MLTLLIIAISSFGCGLLVYYVIRPMLETHYKPRIVCNTKRGILAAAPYDSVVEELKKRGWWDEHWQRPNIPENLPPDKALVSVPETFIFSDSAVYPDQASKWNGHDYRAGTIYDFERQLKPTAELAEWSCLNVPYANGGLPIERQKEFYLPKTEMRRVFLKKPTLAFWVPLRVSLAFHAIGAFLLVTDLVALVIHMVR